MSFLYAGGPGRPPSYCDNCRALKRYGTEHKRFREQTIESAWGTPCVRCGLLLLRGQQIDLDHNDADGTYLGYAHAGCNRSAGAAKGNRARRPAPSRSTSHVCAETGCHNGARCLCSAHSRPW